VPKGTKKWTGKKQTQNKTKNLIIFSPRRPREEKPRKVKKKYPHKKGKAEGAEIKGEGRNAGINCNENG